MLYLVSWHCNRALYSEFARLQNKDSAGFVATEEAEKDVAEMSKVYDETGKELHMGQGNLEHD